MSDTKWVGMPWHYQEESDAYTHIVRDAQGGFVGSTPQSTSGEAEATAKLWAAAPELYEAVQKHYDRLTCICKLNAIVAPLGAGIECTKCTLAPLLAKARGETCAS